MKDSKLIYGIIVEKSQSITMEELCQLIHCKEEMILNLIENQLIQPTGSTQREWRFDSVALKRTRIAVSFYRDLEINLQGIALALELMDKIDSLQSQVNVYKKIIEK